MALRLLVHATRRAEAPEAEAFVVDDAAQMGTDGQAQDRARPDGPRRLVRVSLDPPSDLLVVASSGADGVLLEAASGHADVERLGARLAVAEAEAGLADGALRVVAVVDTPAGALALPTHRATPRLSGIACDPLRLASALGCAPDAPPVVQARALTVLAAAACGVPAILVARRRDEAAERDGFAALLLDADR